MAKKKTTAKPKPASVKSIYEAHLKRLRESLYGLNRRAAIIQTDCQLLLDSKELNDSELEKQLAAMTRLMSFYFGKNRFKSLTEGFKFLCTTMSDRMITDKESAEGGGVFGYTSFDGADLGISRKSTSLMLEIIFEAKKATSSHHQKCGCGLCLAVSAYEGKKRKVKQ